MAKVDKEASIKRIMAGLHCTREEAEGVFAYDMKVEHGEKTEYDLPADKRAVVAAMTRTGTRKVSPALNLPKKERKPNATITEIIALLGKILPENDDFEVKNLTIPEKGQKISFKIGEKWYSLSATEHRTKPKWVDGD